MCNDFNSVECRGIKENDIESEKGNKLNDSCMEERREGPREEEKERELKKTVTTTAMTTCSCEKLEL